MTKQVPGPLKEPRNKLFIKQEIATLERELRDAEEWERKMESGTPKALAEVMHSFCTDNHTDMCGWSYESWENPGYTREAYLKRAAKILKEAETLMIKPVQAIEFIQMYEESKRH